MKSKKKLRKRIKALEKRLKSVSRQIKVMNLSDTLLTRRVDALDGENSFMCADMAEKLEDLKLEESKRRKVRINYTPRSFNALRDSLESGGND